jgi:hypothetical protein
VNAHILENSVFLEQPGYLFEQILVALALCSALTSILVDVLKRNSHEIFNTSRILPMNSQDVFGYISKLKISPLKQEKQNETSNTISTNHQKSQHGENYQRGYSSESLVAPL